MPPEQSINPRHRSNDVHQIAESVIGDLRKNDLKARLIVRDLAQAPLAVIAIGRGSAISAAPWAHSAPLQAPAHSARRYRMRGRRHPIGTLATGSDGTSERC